MATESTSPYGSIATAGNVALIDTRHMVNPITVCVTPSSATVLVEAAGEENAVTSPATAGWVAWPAGTVAVATQYTILGNINGIRVTLVSGTSVKYQVIAPRFRPGG